MSDEAPRLRAPGPLVFGALVLVAVVTAVVWFTTGRQGSAASSEPDATGMLVTLADLERTEIVAGEAALREVAEMHNRSDIPINEATIARYGKAPASAEVWVGRTLNSEMATKLTNEMAESIAEGRSPFSSATWIADDAVWQTSGMGQVHYFFPRGNGVWWLSIGPDDAATALSQVIALAERPSS